MISINHDHDHEYEYVDGDGDGDDERKNIFSLFTLKFYFHIRLNCDIRREPTHSTTHTDTHAPPHTIENNRI